MNDTKDRYEALRLVILMMATLAVLSVVMK